MLDPIDEKILRVLEKDARVSFTDLAEQIGLTKTPSWARVRELERQKVITGYRAEIAPSRVGLTLHGFVQVSINTARHQEFEQAVLHCPSVLECYATAGQGDYLLHILVADIEALDNLLREEISRMPGVERLVTTVGMKTIKGRGLIMECARHP